MLNVDSLIVVSPVELAELAARAAEGMTCFEVFQDIGECSSDIEAGLAICEILTEGYQIKRRAELRAQDIPVWRAFQKASEEVDLDEKALADVATQASSVRKGVLSILENKPVSDADLTSYRRFFLRLAVSLGC